MLKMNSRAILKKKGTIEGIESLLSLFGLKSKRWFESMFQDDYRTKQTLSNSRDVKTYLDYDYNIIEYVTAKKQLKDINIIVDKDYSDKDRFIFIFNNII